MKRQHCPNHLTSEGVGKRQQSAIYLKRMRQGQCQSDKHLVKPSQKLNWTELNVSSVSVYTTNQSNENCIPSCQKQSAHETESRQQQKDASG